MFTLKIKPKINEREYSTAKTILVYQTFFTPDYKLSDMLKALAFFMTKPMIARCLGVSRSYVFRALNGTVSTENDRYRLVMNHIGIIIKSSDYDQYKYLQKGLVF